MNNKIVGAGLKTTRALINNEVLMYGGLKTDIKLKSGICVIYKGLYTTKDYKIDKLNNKKFIMSHNIIKFSDDVYSSVYPDPLECYEYMREDYLKELKSDNSDVLVSKIVKKYGAKYYKNGVKVD